MWQYLIPKIFEYLDLLSICLWIFWLVNMENWDCIKKNKKMIKTVLNKNTYLKN